MKNGNLYYGLWYEFYPGSSYLYGSDGPAGMYLYYVYTILYISYHYK